MLALIPWTPSTLGTGVSLPAALPRPSNLEPRGSWHETLYRTSVGAYGIFREQAGDFLRNGRLDASRVRRKHTPSLQPYFLTPSTSTLRHSFATYLFEAGTAITAERFSSIWCIPLLPRPDPHGRRAIAVNGHRSVEIMTSFD